MTKLDQAQLVEVVKTATQRVYALGAYRAELSRVTQRRWVWRVWHVLGARVESGGSTGLKESKRAAWALLLRCHVDGEP